MRLQKRIFIFFSFFQNYSMDCYFRQYWRDERLGFTGLQKNTHKLTINQLSLNVKMLEKIWKPDTYFHNGLSSYLHTITRPNKLLRISEHGDITYSMRYVHRVHVQCSDGLTTILKSCRNWSNFRTALCSRNFQNVKFRPTIQELICHLILLEIDFGKI